MKLGFVSAILADQNLEEVLSIASTIGYDCVEIMCWPKGKSDRRYAGVTHIDVSVNDEASVKQINSLCQKYGISISGLGYYPNPLVDQPKEAQLYINHIKKVIDAAALLAIPVVNTFIGRDHHKSIEDNWPRFKEVWADIISYATDKKIKVAIENCPMYFTMDEWPGGKNLAISPKIWDAMFAAFNSPYFGLNYDPSHMVWQHMDYLKPMSTYQHKLFHIHAKDVRIDKEKLDQVGILAPPNDWHSPKLPGLGEIDWGKFFSILTSVGYQGAVCVEVEDRAYESTKQDRIDALVQCHQFLRQFIPKAIPIPHS